MDGEDPRMFFRFLEPPASWLRTRPGVVCLFRTLQQFEFLFASFDGWAAQKLLYTWTYVSTDTVFEVLSSLWRAMLAEHLQETKSTMISTSLYDSFHNTLGIMHMAPSHTWSGISQVLETALGLQLCS